MKPDSAASGVRSSWLALATKSERMRSIISCSVSSRSPISAAAARAQLDRHDLDPERARRRPRQLQRELGRGRGLAAPGRPPRATPGSRRLASSGLVDRIVAEQRARRPDWRWRRRGAASTTSSGSGRASSSVRSRRSVSARRARSSDSARSRRCSDGRQLVAAERAELRQGRRLAALGERGRDSCRSPRAGARAARRARR